MTTKKITEDEINRLKVASLPTRPTARSAFGGKGYSAQAMKEAFDLLPILITERFNALLDDIDASGGNSILTSLKSGIIEGHTLLDLCRDITSGNFARYLSINGKSAAVYITELENRVTSLEEKIAALTEESE